MGRVKRRGRWAQCDYGGLAPSQDRRVAARKPTNDKKQALPATQKPRVMRIIITVDYARRGPQVVARVTPRHIAKVAGVQGARERPLRPPSGPSRAARTPVRERVFNRMDRVFKQNEHSLGCSSWIVAIQSLSGDSRRSAWRTCQHHRWS